MANKPWGGRFGEKTDRRVEEFSESISFDRRLFEHDIRGSIAHAEMLAHVGLLTPDECQQIVRGLTEIRAEIVAGRGSFVEAYPLFGLDLEDYDSLFTEKLGLLLKIREQTQVHWSGRHRAPLTGQAIYPRPLQDPLPKPFTAP